MASIPELDAFVAESAAVSRPEAAEPGADRRAQPRPVRGRAAARRPSFRSRPTGRSCSTCGRSPTTSPAISPERSAFPSPARASRRRPASCSTPTGPSPCSPRRAAEAERAIARPALRRVPRHRRVRPRRRRGDDRLRWRIDELDGLIEAGATVIDVREHDERDEGYIPGSRNIPYRLMRTCCPDLPATGRSSRSATRARGRRSRRASSGRGASTRAPSWTAGSNDWLARGATAVTFRRCGN